MKYLTGEPVKIGDKVDYSWSYSVPSDTYTGVIQKVKGDVASFTDNIKQLWIKTDIHGKEFMKVDVKDLTFKRRKI